MTSKDHNLLITYYVDVGCLGSNGKQQLAGFCTFLSQQLNQHQKEICTWDVQALTDIYNPHFKYSIHQKKLSKAQATQYLLALKTDRQAFENNIDDIVIDHIDHYLGR